MKKTITSQEIIEQYIESGLVLRETTLNGDYKKGNREGAKIIKIFKILENNLDLAKQTLPKLYSDENVVTRMEAAAQCISLNIEVEEAIKVLESVSNDEENGIFGFNAKMTLKVWHDQGYLKIYPKQTF